MIVHYLWIGDLKSIKDQGYNLGPKYLFEYQKDIGQISVQYRKRELPANFWQTASSPDGSSVINVSCLVGSNGAGKSTVLNFLGLLLSDIRAAAPTPFVIISQDAENANKGKDELFLQYHGIESPNLQNFLGVKIKSYAAIQDQYVREIPSGYETIYYSTAFDFTTPFGGKAISNISTNFLLRADASRLIHTMNHGYSEVELYNVGELDRFINFILGYKEPSLPFELPKGVYVEVFLPNLFSFHRELQRRVEIESEALARLPDNSRNLLELLNSYSDYKESQAWSSDSEAFLTSLAMVTLCSYLNDREMNGGDSNLNGRLLALPQEWSLYDKAKWYIIELGKPLKDARVNHILDLLEMLERLIVNGGDKDLYPVVTTNKNTIRVQMERMKAIMQIYRRAVGRSKFVTFNWRGLSSGQLSILSMYSRFYALCEDQHRPLFNKIKKFVILIDEGTEYFHPEWQRMFVKYILDFLPFVYGSGKTFQIVLTANSPLVISNIPKEHIHFVGGESKGDEIGETFAANIHKLLSNPMFLESTIGAFAEQKINWVIHSLKDQSLHRSEFPLLKQYIDLIGEPIIQKELQRMLYEKQEEDPEWIKAEIERLRMKLSKNGGEE